MFIRLTTKTDKKSGKIYASYQLVESYRTISGPRQKILLTIGSDISLSPAERKELANRIEDILKGTLLLLALPDHIESLAQHFAKLLLQQQSLTQPIEEAFSSEASEENTDFQCVDINSVCHNSVRTIGAEYVALSAYEDLGFEDVFSRLNFSAKQKLAAAGAIIGRAIYPFSERALHNRLQFRSGLDELLGTSFAKLSLDQLYAISDELYQSKAVLEKHLRSREKSLFDLKETIILYDISNTYFEGTCQQHPKAHNGKSKEMRADCPLMSIGVVLDSDGFPKHSQFFEGNINERSTLEEMIKKLNKQEMTQRPIIVLDSGIATKDNVEWLKAEGYAYIVMMKKKDRPFKDDCQEIIIKDKGKQLVKASLKYDEKTDDNILWCHSELREKKELDIRKQKTNRLEDALLSLKQGLKSPRGVKTIEKVHQKIGRLREKYARLAQHYEIDVDPTPDGKTVQNITWKYDEAKVNRSFSGTYTLRTNLKELPAQKIWEIYVMLSEAETCFRCLKSEAGLRPNWHRRPDRIDGHIFLSLLAYHLIATIKKKLQDRGISDSWETIRERLSGHAIVKSSFKTTEGTIYLTKASEPDEYQRTIYTALNLSLRAIKAQKTVLNKDVVSNF